MDKSVKGKRIGLSIGGLKLPPTLGLALLGLDGISYGLLLIGAISFKTFLYKIQLT